MSAVIRAGGSNFDVDAFLTSCTLPEFNVFRRGELVFPWSKPGDRPREASYVVIEVSEADFDEFSLQVEDAVEFLTAQHEQVRRLCTWPGVEIATLAFGIAQRRELYAQTSHLPTELVRLAGALGLALEVSHYAVSDEDEDGVAARGTTE